MSAWLVYGPSALALREQMLAARVREEPPRPGGRSRDHHIVIGDERHRHSMAAAAPTAGTRLRRPRYPLRRHEPSSSSWDHASNYRPFRDEGVTYSNRASFGRALPWIFPQNEHPGLGCDRPSAYIARSATAGSIRAARRAGTSPAAT